MITWYSTWFSHVCWVSYQLPHWILSIRHLGGIFSRFTYRNGEVPASTGPWFEWKCTLFLVTDLPSCCVLKQDNYAMSCRAQLQLDVWFQQFFLQPHVKEGVHHIRHRIHTQGHWESKALCCPFAAAKKGVREVLQKAAAAVQRSRRWAFQLGCTKFMHQRCHSGSFAIPAIVLN